MSDVVELAEVPELFERWLAGRPLADRSRREYARNVRAYCDWLSDTPPTAMAGRATRWSIRLRAITPPGNSADICRSSVGRRCRR
jgi:hypothetical protein